MSNAYYKVKKPENEPILTYGKDSSERAKLKTRLKELKETQIEIPLIIGGKEIYTGNTQQCVIPHNKEHVLATYHMAGEKEIEMAIKAALEAKKEWDEMPW